MQSEQTAPREVPDWVTQTHEIANWSGYFLHVLDDNTFEEDIELTRDEYIELKAHLAKMRGYVSA